MLGIFLVLILGKFFSTNKSQLNMPAIGQRAPEIKGTAVINGQFKEIKLDDYKGKYLVLFFYPLDL